MGGGACCGVAALPTDMATTDDLLTVCIHVPSLQVDTLLNVETVTAGAFAGSSLGAGLQGSVSWLLPTSASWLLILESKVAEAFHRLGKQALRLGRKAVRLRKRAWCRLEKIGYGA